MAQSIPDNSCTPEKSRNKIKENCHPEGRHIKHGKEIARKACNASGHVYEVVIRSPIFALFEKPGFCTFKNLVADSTKENVHSHADYPENEHVERCLGVDEIQNACHSLKCKKWQHQREQSFVPLRPHKTKQDSPAPANYTLQGNKAWRQNCINFFIDYCSRKSGE